MKAHSLRSKDAIDARNPLSCMHAYMQTQAHHLTPIKQPMLPKRQDLIIKINPKPLPDLITIPIENQRRRRNQHCQKRKHRNPHP